METPLNTHIYDHIKAEAKDINLNSIQFIRITAIGKDNPGHSWLKTPDRRPMRHER